MPDQRRTTMNDQDFSKIDLETIERQARRMRARYIADLFKRRAR